jgi:hypothetical protein
MEKTIDTEKKNMDENPGADDAPKPNASSSSFGKIGLLEAINGNIILRGRHGERDHLYPLEKALQKYDETAAYAAKMLMYGMPQWDEMMQINEEFKFRILEALNQRRSLNIETPKELLDKLLIFEQAHSSDPVIKGTK